MKTTAEKRVRVQTNEMFWNAGRLGKRELMKEGLLAGIKAEQSINLDMGDGGKGMEKYGAVVDPIHFQ